MPDTEKKVLVASDLNGFTGSENHYLHPMSGMKYTDGIKYLAEKAGAYWLLDAIFSYRRKESFQLWILKLYTPKDKRYSWCPRGALLTMQEDSGADVLVKQEIKFTDFPLKEGIELYLCDGVLLLKSEY